MSGSAPELVWVIWAGDNSMTARRRQSVEEIREKSGLRVVLVTPETLPAIRKQHSLPELPEAYQYLSVTHKSDYLRMLLAKHVGGAYVDIKPINRSIRPCLLALNKDPQKDFLGQRVLAPSFVASLGTKQKESMGKNISKTTCFGFFVSKPDGKFATEMVSRMERYMEQRLPALRRSPAVFGRQVCGTGYPIPWVGLLGNIGQTMQMEDAWHSRVLQVPPNHILNENRWCHTYRGIEGDAIAPLWFCIAPTQEAMDLSTREVSRFNGRCERNWRLVHRETRLASIAVLKKVQDQMKGWTVALVVNTPDARLMTDEAERMFKEVKEVGFTKFCNADGAVCVAVVSSARIDEMCSALMRSRTVDDAASKLL